MARELKGWYKVTLSDKEGQTVMPRQSAKDVKELLIDFDHSRVDIIQISHKIDTRGSFTTSFPMVDGSEMTAKIERWSK